MSDSKDPFPTVPNSVGPNDTKLVAPDYVAKEGDLIMEALRKAKPRILEEPGGLNPPRITVAPASPLLQFGRGTVTVPPKADPFPSDVTEQIAGGGTSQITPFFVTVVPGVLPNTQALQVYPGKIASIVPTINGVKLDNDPKPKLPVTAIAPFSLFLRAKITVDTDNLYRSAIGLFPPTSTDVGVKVCTDNDADVTPDIDGTTGEVPELTVFWEDSPANTKGHFYILIATLVADVDMHITSKVQWLFDSYSSFVAAGNEVIILV